MGVRGCGGEARATFCSMAGAPADLWKSSGSRVCGRGAGLSSRKRGSVLSVSCLGSLGSLLLFCGLLSMRIAAADKLDEVKKDDWQQKWCELNDCTGERTAEKNQMAMEYMEKEMIKAFRRYTTTGEVKAVKTESVARAYFGYDGPVLDHPAFPGVANEHAQRAERKHEAFAIEQRKEADIKAVSPAQPEGGFLLPNTAEASSLAVRKQEETAVAMARRRHYRMKEEVRIGCMYEYGQNPDGHGGYILGQITTIRKPTKGCAAGSVFVDDGRGGVRMASRTAESAGSVWRKVNGTDREWFEDVVEGAPGVPWVESLKEIKAKKLKPYKLKAPPPCAPGYGGAFCKIELGTGGDYVDQDDIPPPWAQLGDVERLKAFWKEQYVASIGKSLPGVDLKRYHQGDALPLDPQEYTAGTADRTVDPKENHCSCPPDDLQCIVRCTNKAIEKHPKRCKEVCDDDGKCRQVCEEVDPKKPKEQPKVQKKKKKEEEDTSEKIAASTREAIGGGSNDTGSSQSADPANLNLCEPGSFSKTGSKPCAPCAPGTYMPGTGARMCARCERGTFQNASGAISCESCGDDTVSKEGATSAKDCGEHARVTGIQRIPYETKVDESVVVEGTTGDGAFKPTPFGGASGAWYGGWWLAVYGKNLGKSANDLLEISVGDNACKRSVWLSSTSSACMVPRGMGLKLPVTVGLKKDSATVDGKFSYEAPIIDSYHPRNGAPRGGFWVTITGRHFGHVDTSPTAYLAGRICFETYWKSDNMVLCRGPPGVGGPAMLHHIDVLFEPAEHVQDMPRRLRNWVRSILASKAETVGAQRNASKPMVEIDVKAAQDKAGKALARTVGDGSQAASDDGEAKGSGRSKTAKAAAEAKDPETRMALQKQDWNEREQQVKAEMQELAELAPVIEEQMMASYLERVEERDAQREKEEKEAREKRAAHFKALQEEEARIRQEEADRLLREEEKKKAQAGATDKKLEKFKKAKEEQAKKKAAVEAKGLMTKLTKCVELIEMDCKSGACKMGTEEALGSSDCNHADLAKANEVITKAGISDSEVANKIVALVYDLNAGKMEAKHQLEKAEKDLPAAQRKGPERYKHAVTAKDAVERAIMQLSAVGLKNSEEMKKAQELEKKILQAYSQANSEEQKRLEEEKKKEERRIAEEAKKKAAEEAKQKAANEAKQKAEEEAKRKAEEEAKKKAEEEAKKKAAEEAKQDAPAAKSEGESAQAAADDQTCSKDGTCKGNAAAPTTEDPPLPRGATAAPPKQGGIGLGLKPVFEGEGDKKKNVGFSVSKFKPGGPAEQSGQIQVGDVLHAVDEQDVRGLQLKELAEKMQGPEGSEMRLKLLREGKEIQVTLARKA